MPPNLYGPNDNYNLQNTFYPANKKFIMQKKEIKKS